MSPILPALDLSYFSSSFSLVHYLFSLRHYLFYSVALVFFLSLVFISEKNLYFISNSFLNSINKSMSFSKAELCFAFLKFDSLIV